MPHRGRTIDKGPTSARVSLLAIVSFTRFFLALALLAGAVLVPRDLSAQQTDVIRGRIVGPDSAAIENAMITVTSVSGNVSRTARTDRNGRFTVTFPGGDGDYMVSVAAIGFAARRFEVKRTADQEILVADARLTKVGAVLDAVEVTAPRQRVSRNDAAPDVSGTERPITNAAVPAADMGDLAAMAATLPGVSLVPGENGDPNGYSVLGLGADQNNTTLNGMSFGGSSLPRDAAVSSALITSPYDVSRGGFSGAQLGLRTRPGSNFVIRGASLNVDAPQMQWTDRASAALGQQYTNLSLGGLFSGPLRTDRSFYSVAYQLGRRSSDLETLIDVDEDGLRAAGVSEDSVARLLDVLAGGGVPATVQEFPNDRIGDNGSLLGSFDFTPPSSTAGHAFNVSLNGSWNRQRPAGSVVTELPTMGGERRGWRGGAQARHSGYFGVGILSETSFGISEARNFAEPYLELPAGRVRVQSVFDDGSSGVQTLAFGGSQSFGTSQRTTTLAAMNQLSWFSASNSHRVKLTSELRHEGVSQDATSNRLGTFTFNSLEDLENDRPASYTRQLSPRRHEVDQLVWGLSLGDAWRKTPDLQIQYGVRLDGNAFLDAPDRNPELEQLYGVRNDRVPNRAYVSPRIGFSWTYGTAAQIAGFEGAMRGPRAVVRGGIGVFQNTPATTMLGNAMSNTGLPDAVRQLTCIGDAAPIPDWDSYLANPGSVPDSCADGTTGTVFANAAPSVTLFAKNWQAPRSVRSNLQWNGPTFRNRFSTTVEATWSLNLQQQGVVDRNFDPTTRFTLDGEGDRPVFVNPTSIVPATGQIASRDARVDPGFNRVSELRSDLRSESRQLSLRIAPVRYSQTFSWNLSYVLAGVRERTRGFGSTAGNPLDIEWARSPQASRHQVVYNLSYDLFDVARVNWFGSVRSGTPFTPMVAGDVNGDGYSNDRAFIFDPSTAADPALAASMRALLEHGSDAARDCLRRQLGQLASRNSCEGPWTQTANLSLTFNPLKVRMPQRATLSFQLANPLGAADLLLHGSKGQRGWGQPATPDAALLYVRGFDPSTQRYRYEVNERFGRTNPAFSAFRSPVTLTAMLRFDLGPTRERQMLTQQLDRGRRTQGTRPPEMMIRAMLGSGGMPNPMATILRQQDTLRLSGMQADSIASINRRYTIRLDSIWAPVSHYLATLPDDYDHDEAFGRYLRARRATVDMLARLAPTVKQLLTPEQRRRLPAFVASYLEPRYLASIRNGTGSFTGGGGMPGGMMPAGGGGGGGNVTIIRQGGP